MTNNLSSNTFILGKKKRHRAVFPIYEHKAIDLVKLIHYFDNNSIQGC